MANMHLHISNGGTVLVSISHMCDKCVLYTICDELCVISRDWLLIISPKQA